MPVGSRRAWRSLKRARRSVSKRSGLFKRWSASVALPSGGREPSRYDWTRGHGLRRPPNRIRRLNAAFTAIVSHRASSAPPTKYSTKRLVEAARERGHVVRVLDPLRCYVRIAPGAVAIRYKGKMLEAPVVKRFRAVLSRTGMISNA